MASLKVKLLLGFSVVGLVLIIVGAVVGWKVLTDYVDDEIAESTKLAEGTEQYDRWVKLPFDKTFKVHYFNVDNANDVLESGAKPRVTQIGPFVYKESVHKENIVYNEKTGILAYDDYSDYTFDTEATSAENQAITEMTVLNVPMMGLIQTLENIKDIPDVGETLLAGIYYLIDAGYTDMFPGSEKLFLKIKPSQYSFDGYDFCIPKNTRNWAAKILCGVLRMLNKESLPTQPDRSIKFSFFGRKQGTSDGRWETNSGNLDINQLGSLISWNGERYTKYWGGDYCNEIRGGDSIVYAPYNDKDTEFDVYSSDICRSVTLRYVDDIEHKEIPGYKNILREDTIDMSGEKKCYCIGKVRGLDGEKTECLPTGFMDMSTCQDAPIILSFPHFLWADPATSATVDGLNAVEDDHVTFIEMQPDTGSPLRGSKRVQFNMILRKFEKLVLTEKIGDGSMLPLVWVDEGSEISDDLAKKLQEDYLDKLVLVDGVRWGMIAIGIALFVGCGGFYFFTRNSKKIDSSR